MNGKRTPLVYEAHVILRYPPPGSPAAGKPIASLVYFDSNGAEIKHTPDVYDGDSLEFSLWRQDGYADPVQSSDGDLVLIPQYDADPAAITHAPKSRRSPFKNGQEMSIHLKDKKANPNSWVLDVHLNGASGKTWFEYSVVALPDTASVAVIVDPSIIINPN